MGIYLIWCEASSSAVIGSPGWSLRPETASRPRRREDHRQQVCARRGFG